MNFLPHRRSLAVRDALLCSPEALAGRRLCCCTPPAAGCSRGLPGFGRCGICAKSSDSLRKICVRISQHHVQTVCIVSRSALAEQAPMKLNASNQHLISAAATTTSAAASATAATATLALLRQRRVMVDGICTTKSLQAQAERKVLHCHKQQMKMPCFYARCYALPPEPSSPMLDMSRTALDHHGFRNTCLQAR